MSEIPWIRNKQGAVLFIAGSGAKAVITTAYKRKGNVYIFLSNLQE